MKLTLFFVLISFFVNGQNSYSISVKMKNAEGKKIFLKDTWATNDPRVKANVYDSGYFVNGLVNFNGNFEDYKYYNLSFESDKSFFPFIMDTGKIMIVGDASKIYQSEVYNSIQNALEKKYSVVVDSFFLKENNFKIVY